MSLRYKKIILKLYIIESWVLEKGPSQSIQIKTLSLTYSLHKTFSTTDSGVKRAPNEKESALKEMKNNVKTRDPFSRIIQKNTSKIKDIERIEKENNET